MAFILFNDIRGKGRSWGSEVPGVLDEIST